MEIVSESLLHEFLRELERIEAPVARSLNPGLSDSEIDELLIPVGIDLPEEARQWWRWRNGSDESAGDAQTLFGERHFVTLADEGEYYRDSLRYNAEAHGLRSLLKPLDQKPYVYCDCGVHRDAPVPIYLQDDIETPRQILPSIGSLVRRWIVIMRSGFVSVGSDGLWVYHDSARPPSNQLEGFD